MGAAAFAAPLTSAPPPPSLRARPERPFFRRGPREGPAGVGRGPDRGRRTSAFPPAAREGQERLGRGPDLSGSLRRRPEVRPGPLPVAYHPGAASLERRRRAC